MSITNNQTCTFCSQPVVLQHQQTHCRQCSCGKTLVYKQKNGAFISKYLPSVQASDSQLCVGAKGVFQDNVFTVLGRWRLWLQESVYSYWTIAFDNQQLAIIAEGYGIWAVLQFATPAKFIGNAQAKKPGEGLTGITASGNVYLQHYYYTHFFEIEGEVWLPVDCSYIEIRELLGDNENCYELFTFDHGHTQLFEATPIQPEALQLQTNHAVQLTETMVTCKQCSSTQAVWQFPYTRSFACQQCGSYHAFNRNRDWQLVELRKQPNHNGILKPGMKGRLEGKDYLVISYCEKTAHNGNWQEYGLLNSNGAYAFLSVSMGHWMLVSEQYHGPRMGNKKLSADFKNHAFALYYEYSWKVTEAAGSFPYNVFNDNDTKALEYISPPYMLIQEKDADEGITWYLGEHVSAKAVAKAFEVSVPYQSGIGPIQPTNKLSKQQWQYVLALCIIAILVVQLLSGLLNSSKQLEVATINFDTLTIADKPKDTAYYFGSNSTHILQANKTVVLGPYELTKWRSNLQIDIQAPLNNSWAAVTFTLVEKNTGKEYAAEEGMEYYSGYTDGESWSEGDNTATVYFSRLPKGVYTLQVDAQRQADSDTSFINLWVYNDTPMWRNFWWCLLAIVIYPLWMIYRVYSTDRLRWENSPYSSFD